MKRSLPLLTALLLLIFISNAQDKVIPLYSGAAPGSESWTWDEATNTKNIWNTDVVYNVSKPTLTVFEPAASQATGTAVIICPGGGFHALSINSEGYDVARWLVKKGITCFVLKYRLIHCVTNEPVAEFMSKLGKPELQTQMQEELPMAIADGKAAIAYVRSHADAYGINKNKIGIIGFSAGGTVTTGSAFGYTVENRPDFIAPIYPFYPPEMVTDIPADAPPMFLVVASDDGFQLTPHSVNLYQKWQASKHSAELHVYSTGNHGFGMRQQQLPSDSWTDRFADWLKLQGYLKPLQLPDWAKNYNNWQLDQMLQRDRQDWQNLGRYRDENAALANSKSDKPRVVFMGNSITDAWIDTDSAFFAGKNYIDRGISGQTTPQMLVRFRPDVIDLKPAVVVILAGINDIAGNTGHMTLEETFGNIVSMVELAKANKIKPVISSVLPAYDFPWRPGMQPADKVIQLNAMLKDYATKNNVIYLDYFSAMKDERNGLPKNLSEDGVHPNLTGYKIMEPLVEKAIAEALKQK